MRRKSVVVWCVVALVCALAPAVSAHPLPHGDTPRIVNVRPAPGGVVQTGRVEIAALATANRPIASHRLAVDREDRSAASSGGDHATISATLELDPGWHTVELWVTTDAGDEAYRRWRFRVGEFRGARIAGDGRVATAVAVSEQLHPAPLTAAAAVLARADDYPDALAGAPLAAAMDGPLLLTGTDELSQATAEELRRVLPPGRTVTLLGGAAALSDQVRRDVEELGFFTERLEGRTRFDTAAQIARRLPDHDAAVVASGESFADALAASSAAASTGRPILLTGSTTLPDATSRVLDDRGVTEVTVVGGPNAVSDGVIDALRAQVGADGVRRLAGATRFDTSVAVAEHFFAEAETFTVASGEHFPDALAGGVHAAAHSAPVLLSAAGALPPVVADLITSRKPDMVFLYGGGAALHGGVVADLRAAHVSDAVPKLAQARPGGTAESLDEVVLTFDRDLDVAASSVHVTVGGHEVGARLGIGDFASTLVLTIDELPEHIEHEVSYPVHVVIAAISGEHTRHLERRFELRRPPRSLVPGDRGAEVEDLQRRLQANRYWVGRIDGVYGTLTAQAVMALQKVHGLEPDGTYTPDTRTVLEGNPALPAPRSTSGFFYEVDLQRRVLMVVSDGQVAWVINTSAGHGQTYTFQGSTFRANTTTGRHRVTRQIDGMREAERGKLWRPKYYDTRRGIAIHGSTSVPAHHASSGCIRVTYPAMDFLWSIDPHTGANVWVYPEAYYG